MGENRVIGNKGQIPWQLPSDQKRFRALTLGHPVIMGRKTYESIGRLLPKRSNIIVTRDTNYAVEGAIVCHSLNEAFDEAKKVEKEEIFVIGGGQIYHEAIALADKLYLTIVKGTFEGDATFPEYGDFKKVIFEEKGTENGHEYKFIDVVKFLHD